MQIVINADKATHAWVKAKAKKQARTMGAQALHILRSVKDEETADDPSKPLAKEGVK